MVWKGLHTFIAKKQICFCLLSAENICVQERDAGLLVKVTDFGSAKLPQEKIEFVGWTPEYMSPESSLLFLQKR